MSRARSELVNALEGHARDRPTDTALIFLSADARPVDQLTFGELHARSRAFAARLIRRPDPHSPVLLLIKPDAASVVALCGCLYAGAPCAPAPTPGRNGSLVKLAALASASQAGMAVAHGELDYVRQAAPQLAWLDATSLGKSLYEEVPSAREAAFAGEGAGPDSLALIQFTSGSTRDPKGVELTHGNVVANLEMLRVAFEVDANSCFASWLPLFHDMGLAMLMMPLYFGVPGVLMPPLAFIRRPGRWLQMVQAHRATITGAPNFAFDLCLERVSEKEARALDLSSCRIAFCGAEPVRRATMLRFVERFSAQGLSPSALYPCYGLAEAVTFVSGGRFFGGFEAPSGIGSHDPVPCGTPAVGSDLAIVDPATLARLGPGEVGEVWVAGPHVGRGYLGLPKESAAVFAARLGASELPYLRTGDLGSLDGDGRLALIGRMKDVLIHRGANIHASDVEAAVAESHPGYAVIGAAFSVPSGEGEGVVVVQEAARGATPVNFTRMPPMAFDAVAAGYGLRLHDLVLVRPGALPKTTSGKVRRDEARRLYLEGGFANLLDAGEVDCA